MNRAHGAPMAIFSGNDLTCIRGEREVFSDLSFNVSSGEALYLTGANGSGKSSILRIMSSLLRPADGKIQWDGNNIFDNLAAHHDRLIYVGHFDAVKLPLTIRENLMFWAGLAQVSKDRRGETVDKTLEPLGLASIADTPARFLSAGQRRRLNLARLTLGDTPLWLLDEPATSLDIQGATALAKMLDRHLKMGGMAVIATHDPVPAGAMTLSLNK